jgi:hypothetical protein
MKRSLKTLVSAVAGLGFLTSMAIDASACGGRGGGGGYRANFAPRYYPQQYPQAQCAPQQYQQFPQQQFPQQQFPQQQFSQASQQQFPQQQAQQQIPQQQVQQQIPQQQFSQQAVPQGQGTPMAQNTVAAQTRVVAKPVSTGGANLAGANAAAPVAAAPQQSADGSAEMSALQALSGWDGSEQESPNAEATSQSGFNATGDFVATLANGATVRLRMMEDSTFTWIATNKGKNSSFQGTFSVEAGSLKLLRSSDNQKLEGTLGQTQNGFTFNLGGQNATNLNFIRS